MQQVLEPFVIHCYENEIGGLPTDLKTEARPGQANEHRSTPPHG
jgi:hypothetical protein